MMDKLRVIIRLESKFGTPIRGDTLFGHIFWQLIEKGLVDSSRAQKLVKSYSERPFVVVSDAFPTRVIEGQRYFYFPRPSVPLSYLFGQTIEKNVGLRKYYQKLSWFWLREDEFISGLGWLFKDGRLVEGKTFDELNKKEEKEEQEEEDEKEKERIKKAALVWSVIQEHHNSLARSFMKTTEKSTPYVLETYLPPPDYEMVIFMLVDQDQVPTELILKALEEVGLEGYGRDATWGRGRFSIVDVRTAWGLLRELGSTAYYTLAPCVPGNRLKVKKSYFRPAVRFGRHGRALARSSNPFKNPIIMADTGAVFLPEVYDGETDYIGTGLSNLSKTLPQTVAQGYAPILHLPLTDDLNSDSRVEK